MRVLLGTLAALLVLAGCGGTAAPHRPSPGSPPSGPSSPIVPSAGAVSPGPPGAPPPRVLGTVADHLKTPWGIAFLPDGSALVTERDTGRVLRLHGPGDHRATPVGHVRVVSVPGGESGLLGIAVSPSYSRDHRVFLYACRSSGNEVLRGTLRHGRLGRLAPILRGIPHGAIHNGGRLAFGPDGSLYVSTGETGDSRLAQDRGSLGGKILRITRSGQPAPGDPFPGSPVWTYGHRNVEGLAFDPSGRLWATEFGQDTWDEINLIRRGRNYGWPIVEGRASGHPKLVNPKVQWHTDLASPSGLAYAAGSLWAGALRGERLWQVPLHGRRTGKPEGWFSGRYGRLRTVVRAPDGRLWVTTSNTDGRGNPGPRDDRILLVRP